MNPTLTAEILPDGLLKFSVSWQPNDKEAVKKTVALVHCLNTGMAKDLIESAISKFGIDNHDEDTASNIIELLTNIENTETEALTGEAPIIRPLNVFRQERY